MDGVANPVIRYNAVYDWSNPTGGGFWGLGFDMSGATGSVTFSGNRVYQPSGGQIIYGFSASGMFTGNRYWSTLAGCFNGQPWSAWQSRESGSTFGDPGPRDVSITAYMAHLGLPGGLPEFMALARANCKQHWDVRFTAGAVNAWARGVFGIPNP
jgi:hypothetical protein